jgi:hypothetical protein
VDISEPAHEWAHAFSGTYPTGFVSSLRMRIFQRGVVVKDGVRGFTFGDAWVLGRDMEMMI